MGSQGGSVAAVHGRWLGFSRPGRRPSSRGAFVTILEAMADPVLFRPWFKPWKSWAAWRAFLAALFALPMTADELAIYQAHTGRTSPPAAPFRECWVPVGRRGGKSRIVALIATFLAAFKDYKKFLAPGERGLVMVAAADRRQARVVFRYIEAFFDAVPMLADLVESRTMETLTLTNGISIEVVTSNAATVRGFTVVVFIGDEVPFWPADEESANPAAQIFAAIRPATITIPSALILGIGSPRGKTGPMWDAVQTHFERDGAPVLVWSADTRSMNPSAPESLIEQAFVDDPVSAASEYGRAGRVEFRSDLAAFVDREIVEEAVAPHRHELPPAAGVNYSAFVDPSGGSQDSMTLAIAHAEGARVVIDVVRERRPPFSPEDVVEEFVALLKSYRVNRVRGDAYAGLWPREQFTKRHVEYELSDLPKSSLYRELLPILNGGRIELPDNPRLVMQLSALERRVARGGRDSIDHPRGGHDDVANAVAGAAVHVAAPLTGAAAGLAFLQRHAERLHMEKLGMNPNDPAQLSDFQARKAAGEFPSSWAN